MLHAINLSTSGLEAQRQRINTIAGNIANINTTRDDKGNLSPFQRQIIQFQAAHADNAENGVGVQYHVTTDPSAKTRKVPDPDHPDAVDGFVSYPDISLNTEFVNAIEASRAYEANIAAIEISKSMFNQGLRILG